MPLRFPFCPKTLFVAGVSSLVAGTLVARPIGNMSGTEYFESKVRPLFVKHCYECHSEAEQKQKGGLLLDRESGWLEGGDTGKAVIPGQPEASLLVEVVQRLDEDSAMPPKYPLEEEEIAILVRWVKGGAPGPKEDMGETEFSQLGDQEVIFEKAEEHWSFRPVQEVAPPEVSHSEWNRNPIDRFVFAKLEEAGLTPSSRAGKRTLVRRLSYSLTGLPPTDPELISRPIPDLINQFLESPALASISRASGSTWLAMPTRRPPTALTRRRPTTIRMRSPIATISSTRSTKTSLSISS